MSFPFPSTNVPQPNTRLSPPPPQTSASSTTTGRTGPTKSPHSPPAGSGPDLEDIEMEPMNPSGHRRRRSSVLNPVNVGTTRHRSPRPLSKGGDEPKIPEERAPGEPLQLQELHSDAPSDEDLHDDEEAGLTGRDRRRKRRKRRRNQMLDQRIARDRISADEKKAADRNVVKQLLINAGLIGLWYFFSLLISLYNKWMFSPDKLGFPYPMFTTAVHMLVQFSLASLVLFLFPSFRPNNAQTQSMEKVTMSKMFYITRIGPCGVATGLDIGLGNTSLQFITLTFYTMCKSSSLAFVLLFAFLLRLETPTWKLVAIIGTMTIGVVMMVAGEVEFKLGGFVLVISAAFFSGFRWALTQILLLRNPATSNPFSSIFFLAPVMFMTLLTIAIPVEGVSGLLTALKAMAEERGYFTTPIILLFPGAIAFCMTASEFALLQRTSVVTLSIAGIFKEAVTIGAASLVFGDSLTPVNMVGLVVTLSAITAYNWIKISRMRQEAQTDVAKDHHPDSAGSGSGSGTGSESDREGFDHDDDDEREDVGLLRSEDLREGASEVLFTADGSEVVSRPRDER
ncbi:putative solute carrier [Cladorrhinum samala]|uniref:Solute carrier n=1 Tax=Cladorrhinum samala TaxID=585594 RepID=A0AAV9HEB7_9PEZI|nr:putative solute carrier [Cladorrhinum samala]